MASLKAFCQHSKTTIYYSKFASPIGTMIAAASNKALAGLWFESGRHMPDMKNWKESNEHPILKQTRDEIDSYFKGTLKDFTVPMQAYWGTPLQQSVWESLKAIKPGETVTYGDIAENVGNSKAVRSVSTAIGHNPWSIVVPCHRVIGKDGTLTGYGGGLDKKKALLRLEGIELPAKESPRKKSKTEKKKI